jgi:hypothetical protein
VLREGSIVAGMVILIPITRRRLTINRNLKT